MKLTLSFLLLMFLLFFYKAESQLLSSDCPASPYPIEITQPDNTKIRVIAKGTMLNNHVETQDGYSIVKNNYNFYEYARLIQGRLVPSGFLAGEHHKTPDVETFLSTQTKHLQATANRESFSNTRNQDALESDETTIDLAFPKLGTHKVLVLLIDYPDLPATHTVADFESFMNQENYNGTGSFRDYFLKVSDNKLDVNADVVGWYRADSAYAYYGNQNGYDRSRGLVREAVDAAENAGIDFANYDNDADGYVDGVIVVHAGNGAEEGSQNEYVWSHRAGLGSSYYRFYDDVYISDYMINPERRGWANNGAGDIVGIGVFCHEFGHGLGLPDLYDTDYTSAGIGSWGLMGGGGWLGGEKIPGFMSAWSRVSLEWATPLKVSSGTYSLTSSTATTMVYKINTSISKEYFLLENRQKTDQDAYLAGSGLAIWHIDDNLSTNSDENHRWVDLEQADGLGHLNTKDAGADAGDLYPGSSVNDSFTGSSFTNSNTYDLAASGIEITGITESNGLVSFNVSGGDERFDLVNVSFSLDITNYPGTQTPYIYGGWDNYCANCNSMTDTDGDAIWTSTISMARGDYKFIFIRGIPFVSGTEYEDFNGEAASCNVPTTGVFTVDWYFRTLEVTGLLENQLYGGRTVEWDTCPSELPAISLTTDTTKLLEWDSIKVHVLLSQLSADTVIVGLSGSGSAVLDTDYSLESQVIIIPGDTVGFAWVSALDNEIYSLIDKNLSVTMSSIIYATASAKNIISLLIVNNDPLPILSLHAENTSVNEGDSIQFNAKISRLSDEVTEIGLTYTGTAQKVIDYDVLDVMTIPAGDTISSMMIRVNQNNLYELDKNVSVSIADLTNATSEFQSGLELTIINIDEAPILTITADKLSINEGDSVTLTFSLSTTSGATAGINLGLSGTAESIADYSSLGTTFNIPAGSILNTLTIFSVDDDDYEIDESLNLIFETENVTYNDGDVTITFISEDLLGIGDVVEIAIYPNPTTGMISLEIIDFYEFTIYYLSGKKIMQSYMPSLNINQLKVGTYLLEASDKSGRKVKAKILKK